MNMEVYAVLIDTHAKVASVSRSRRKAGGPAKTIHIGHSSSSVACALHLRGCHRSSIPRTLPLNGKEREERAMADVQEPAYSGRAKNKLFGGAELKLEAVCDIRFRRGGSVEVLQHLDNLIAGALENRHAAGFPHAVIAADDSCGLILLFTCFRQPSSKLPHQCLLVLLRVRLDDAQDILADRRNRVVARVVHDPFGECFEPFG